MKAKMVKIEIMKWMENEDGKDEINGDEDGEDEMNEGEKWWW